MKLVVALLAIGSVIAIGCSPAGEAPPVAPAGTEKSATLKGGASNAKGMSSDSLTVPGGASDANQPGSKMKGGN